MAGTLENSVCVCGGGLFGSLAQVPRAWDGLRLKPCPLGLFLQPTATYCPSSSGCRPQKKGTLTLPTPKSLFLVPTGEMGSAYLPACYASKQRFHSLHTLAALRCVSFAVCKWGGYS